MKTQRHPTVRIDYRQDATWQQFGYFQTVHKVDADSYKLAIAYLSARNIPYRVISGR